MLLVAGLAVAGSARSPLTAQTKFVITFSGSGSSVTVAWTAAASAEGYRILRSLSPTIAGTDITTPFTTTSVTANNFAERTVP